MPNFTVEYLNPFKQEPSKETLFRENEVLDKFQSIDWYQHAVGVFYSHNPPDDGSHTDDAIHDYYYFSVEYSDHNQHVHIINIVPNFMSSSDYTKDDVRFSIEYRRPKIVATSKLSQLFGKPKEKINPEYMSHGKAFTAKETMQLIGDFTRFEAAGLESSLYIEGYLY